MGEYILSGVSLALVALVFWAVKRMVDKVDKKIDDLKIDTDKGFKENTITREGLKVLYLDEKTHKYICGKTQSDFKLHVSEVAKQNREVLMLAVETNLTAVKVMFTELKQALKENGTIK